jgi:hypothetical protein
MQKQIIGWDTETACFGAARMAPKLVVSSVATGPGEVRLFHVLDGRATLLGLFSMAAEGRAVIVGHNVAYDVAVAMAAYPSLDFINLVFEAYAADGVTDTMIRQKLIDIAQGRYRGWRDANTGKWHKVGYYLGELAERHLGRELNKTSPWRTRYEELIETPVADWPAEAVAYAEEDGLATRDVYLSQESDAQFLVDQYRQTRAALALHLSSVWGIRTDAEGVELLRKGAQDEIDMLTPELIREGLLRKNGARALKAAQERMAAVHPTGKKTPTGKPSVDEEACLASGDETLIQFSRFTKAQNVLSKDVKAMLPGTVAPIHTRFDSLMETGRTSCIAKGTMIEVVRDVSKKPEGIPIEDVRPGDLVYAYDNEGALCLRPVKWAGKTGHKEVVRLHWQGDGRHAEGHLDLTPEHRVRLVTGEWVQAQALATGDRILSLSRGTTHGYARLWATGRGEISREHRFIHEELHGEIPDGVVVHHKNGNKLDNRTENLVRITKQEHTRYHSTHESEQTKAKKAVALKRRWAEDRDRLLESVPRGADHPLWLGLTKDWLTEKLHQYHGKPAVLATQEGIDYETLQKYLRLENVDFKSIADQYNARGERITGEWVRHMRDTCAGKGYREIGHLLGMSYYRWARVQREHGYDTPHNHRVVSVERLGCTMDVYNLEIEEHHNFIANGINVANSSSPNLQNPRRQIGVRECFVPRPGFVYAACDYDKAELHTLSQVCLKILGYSRLAERLNQGFDPHLDMGAQMLGITYEEAKARKAEGDPEVKDARQSAKVANFGFPGGMGIKGFREYARTGYGVELSENQAKQLRENYLATWPEMNDYFAWVKALCGDAGVCTIKHLFSGRVRGLITYTVACNSFFQGLAADGAKAALFEVARRQYSDPTSYLFGSRTVNFIHDELLVEVPEHIAHEAATELQTAMIEAFNPWVPDVPVRAGVSLMRRWSKNAEPVWVDGRLVPWEDAA